MKKILKSFLIIFIISILSAIISILFTTNLVQIAEDDTTISEYVTGTCSNIEVLESFDYGNGVLRQPKAYNESGELRNIYCIQPDENLVIFCDLCTKTQDQELIIHTKNQILAWAEAAEPLHRVGGHSNASCGYSYDGLGCNSTTTYYCVNNHLDENSIYTDESGNKHNLYDIAYILSYQQDSTLGIDTPVEWTKATQQAIWMSVLTENYQDRFTEEDDGYYEGEALYAESQLYKNFYQKIIDNGNKMQQGYDVGETVSITTDINAETHVIGPFKIDYIDGSVEKVETNNGYSYGGLSFGGISDMYLVGNDGSRIDIEAFIRTKYIWNNEEWLEQSGNDQNKVYTNYCEPWFFGITDHAYYKDNPNYVDYYDYIHNYADSGEWFYIEIPFVGKDIYSYKLHVEFQYLTCSMQICIKNGEYLTAIDDCRFAGVITKPSQSGSSGGSEGGATEEEMSFIQEYNDGIMINPLFIENEYYGPKILKVVDGRSRLGA